MLSCERKALNKAANQYCDHYNCKLCSDDVIKRIIDMCDQFRFEVADMLRTPAILAEFHDVLYPMTESAFRDYAVAKGEHPKSRKTKQLATYCLSGRRARRGSPRKYCEKFIWSLSCAIGEMAGISFSYGHEFGSSLIKGPMMELIMASLRWFNRTLELSFIPPSKINEDGILELIKRLRRIQKGLAEGKEPPIQYGWLKYPMPQELFST
jgi:hypothetical protein